ncbi:MAG: glycosyltransferase [Succinivibrio sp.]
MFSDNQKEYIVFWGTSKSGQLNLAFWRSIGKTPDFFSSNDPKMRNETFLGIPVISPEEVVSLKNKIIYITSYAIDEITKQLLELGLPKSRIIPLQSPFYSCVLELYKLLEQRYSCKNKRVNQDKSRGCIFEYAFGGALGGTQTWAYSEQNKISKIVPTESIVPSDRDEIDISFNPVILERSDKVSLFDSACNYFLSCRFNTFIGGMDCSEILAAACFVKREYGIKLTVIAVCHVDFNVHYDSYVLLQNDIDYCCVISDKMKNSLIAAGFPASKIMYYPWEPVQVKSYNEEYKNLKSSLRIAYVGRIYVQQKRCDSFITLATLLRSKGIDFILTICGTGEYLPTLKQQIKLNHLENHVIYRGCLDHSQIYDFWHDQDIYVSCSEYEGHSLSQFEALSCGVVAVCTDCSGVSDDVTHEYSGFIVDAGDVKKMAEYIEILDQDRELLELMKKRTTEIFAKKKEDYCDPIVDLIRKS